MECDNDNCKSTDTHPISILGKPIGPHRVWYTMNLCQEHAELPEGSYSNAEIEIGRSQPRRRKY